MLIPHPNRIVIHPAAEIGGNCLIFQQVTIGAGPTPGLPRIVGHVDIGAGAKVLGGVTIGDHARIGANAVVPRDVPAGTTAVGVPARVVGVDPPGSGSVPRSADAPMSSAPLAGDSISHLSPGKQASMIISMHFSVDAATA